MVQIDGTCGGAISSVAMIIVAMCSAAIQCSNVEMWAISSLSGADIVTAARATRDRASGVSNREP